LTILQAKSSSREDLVAALDSLKLSREAQRLLKVADVDIIRNMLTADTRDVRLAACRALGAIGGGNRETVETLLRYARADIKTDEFAIAVAEVARVGNDDAKVQEFVVGSLLRLIGPGRVMSVANVERLGALLRACQEFDMAASPALAELLRRGFGDFKLSDALRKECLMAHMFVAAVDVEHVRWLTGLLNSPPNRLVAAVCWAAGRFVHRCRRRLEYVRYAAPELPEMEKALVQFYRRHKSGSVDEAEALTNNVRFALANIRQMLDSYREFANRRSVES
jgi:hypothetical protein